VGAKKLTARYRLDEKFQFSSGINSGIQGFTNGTPCEILAPCLVG